MNELQELTEKIIEFRKKRNWTKGKAIAQKNTAIALVMEATEVLELFSWTKDSNLPKGKKKELGEELSDVLWWVLVIAHDSGIDLRKSFLKKMKKNGIKYPPQK